MKSREDLERELSIAISNFENLAEGFTTLEKTLREVRSLIEPYTAIDSWMPMHKVKQAVQLIDAKLR